MTWQKIIDGNIEEPRREYKPAILHLTVQNADGEEYEVEDRLHGNTDGFAFGEDEAQAAIDAEDGWVDLDFGARNAPAIQRVRTEAPDHIGDDDE